MIKFYLRIEDASSPSEVYDIWLDAREAAKSQGVLNQLNHICMIKLDSLQ